MEKVSVLLVKSNNKKEELKTLVTKYIWGLYYIIGFIFSQKVCLENEIRKGTFFNLPTIIIVFGLVTQNMTIFLAFSVFIRMI